MIWSARRRRDGREIDGEALLETAIIIALAAALLAVPDSVATIFEQLRTRCVQLATDLELAGERGRVSARCGAT